LDLENTENSNLRMFDVEDDPEDGDGVNRRKSRGQQHDMNAYDEEARELYEQDPDNWEYLDSDKKSNKKPSGANDPYQQTGDGLTEEGRESLMLLTDVPTMTDDDITKQSQQKLLDLDESKYDEVLSKMSEEDVTNLVKSVLDSAPTLESDGDFDIP